MTIESVSPASLTPPQTRSRRETQILWALIGLLGALTVLYMQGPLSHPFVGLELSRNEPWNAWHIDAAWRGENIYPDRDALIVNNYPPLSFYIVGLVARATGDTIDAGRLVALISTLALAFWVYVCARHLGANRTSGGFGALVFLASFFLYFRGYATMNDPNMLALAIMGAGLAWFLARLAKGRSVEPAIAVMVIAGFCKHNIVAIPLSVLIYLWLQDRRQALRAGAFGAALAALGLGLCFVLYGPNFISGLMFPRVMSLHHAIIVAKRLQFVGVALFFGALWAWQARAQKAARFTLIFLIVAVVTGCVQASGEGVHMNAVFEAAFASSIAIALAFDQAPRIRLAKSLDGSRMPIVIVAAVILRLVATQRLDPYLEAFSAPYREDIAENTRVLKREIERVKALPDPVSCSIMTVCYRAGKAFVYDDFAMAQRVKTHRWTAETLEAAKAKAGLRFEEIDKQAYPPKPRLF